jgi:hypothetical protein
MSLFFAGFTEHVAMKDTNSFKRLVRQRGKMLHLIAGGKRQCLERHEALHILRQPVPVTTVNFKLTRTHKEFTIFRNRCQLASATMQLKSVQLLWGFWMVANWRVNIQLGYLEPL